MSTTVTLIPGDGITQELAPHVVRILEAAKAEVHFEEMPAGVAAFEAEGSALPQQTLASIRRNKVALKGKLMNSPRYPNPTAALRKSLDLYASIRPIANLKGLPARHKDVDMVLVRESTEDVYAGLEHRVSEDIVASLKVVTEAACKRVTRYAFEYAQRHKRKKITLVHKANIMKLTDGLFIRTAEGVAARFPDIEFDQLIVDNASMQLLLRPHRYDVILTGNLYGDILSDLGAGIVGGISNTYGAAVGDGVRVFEALHGDVPDLVGQDAANPLPFLMPALYMLRGLGQEEVAHRVCEAITGTLEAGIKTRDIAGTASTSEMVGAIISRLRFS